MPDDREETGNVERDGGIHTGSIELSKAAIGRRIDKVDIRIQRTTDQIALAQARLANLQTRRANLVTERSNARTQAQIDGAGPMGPGPR